MKDYVVYHNPEVMGHAAGNVDPFSVVTNKKVADVRGSRVWLLTGEGAPRTFFICSYFIVEKIESGMNDGFETRLSGTTGKKFNPMIELSDEEWFSDFKRSQGNFAFGFQLINEARFVEGLEAVIS